MRQVAFTDCLAEAKSMITAILLISNDSLQSIGGVVELLESSFVLLQNLANNRIVRSATAVTPPSSRYRGQRRNASRYLLNIVL